MDGGGDVGGGGDGGGGGGGVEVARRFWLNWGRPWLSERYPALLDRIGVGLFSGSEVLGADDALSRDHGWGPRLEIFRGGDDGIPANDALEGALRAAAPSTWEGIGGGYAFAPAIQVHDTAAYFGRSFPAKQLPARPSDWVSSPEMLPGLESHLHFLRHGVVFHDPAGLLREVRQALHVYPEAIWLLRMAQLCFEVAHYGQYNFNWRLVERKDPVAATMAVGAFQQAVMALAVVMDRDYAPYWKWLRHVFRGRAVAARLDGDLVALATELDYGARAARIDAVCGTLMEELVRRAILPRDLDDVSGLPLFFQARAHLLARIPDPVIAALMQ